MFHSKALLAALLLPELLHAQARASRMEFEVASVKVVPITEPGAEQETSRRISYRVILPTLVIRAYEIKPYQLGNPQLLYSSPLPQYDIQATLPPGSTTKDIPEMLRSLLHDRFGLTAHWQEKVMQVYKLGVVSSGLKIERVRLGESPPDRPLQIKAPRQGLVRFRGTATLQQLAEFLSPAMDHPVLDNTGVSGLFQIALNARVPSADIDLSGLPLLALSGSLGPTSPGSVSSQGSKLFEGAADIGGALKQLGLHLEKGKENIAVLVVDAVNKIPTRN